MCCEIMRVTLDLDNTKLKVAEGKAILLKIAYPKARVMYRVSSLGNGCHILMYSNEITEVEMYNIRRLMGDHDKRIGIDMSRGNNGNPMLPKQVLFGFKIKDGKLYRVSEWFYAK